MAETESAKAASSPFDKELAQTLCDLQSPQGIRFSPDGCKVLYSAALKGGMRKGKHSISALWLASASEAGSSRQLTSGESCDRQAAWHPDGNRIAFVSDRAKAGKSAIIWLLRLDGGDPVPITPKDNEKPIEEFAFSPDGRTIAYITADEKTKEDKEKEEKEEADANVWGEKWEYGRLRVVDIETKEVKTLVEGDKHVRQLNWSHDGKTIAFSTTENTEMEEGFLSGDTISTVNVEGGEERAHCTVMNLTLSLTFGVDGKLYFLTGTPIDSLLGGEAVYVINPAESSSEPVKILCGEDDSGLKLIRRGDKVLLSAATRLSTTIKDVGGKALFERDTAILEWDVFFDPKSSAPTLAASLSDPNKPFEVLVVKDGQEDVKLSNHGKELQGKTFGSSTVLTSQSSDGEVELDGIYLTPTSKAGPDGRPKEPLPTIVLIHGGPTSRNTVTFDSHGHGYWTPYLLSRGYGILLPQYRGGIGRGEKFASYSLKGVGGADHHDVISITDDAIKKGFADPKKLMVGGWSQGGFHTYLCSVRNGLHGHGWRFNAGVAGAGICDMDSLAVTSDLGATYEAQLNAGLAPWKCSPETATRGGSALWEVAAAAKQGAIPPMLMLHGAADERCPVTQAQAFRHALRAHGLPFEYVTYPGEPHSVRPQRFMMDILERVSRWCDKYIGPDGDGSGSASK